MTGLPSLGSRYYHAIPRPSAYMQRREWRQSDAGDPTGADLLTLASDFSLNVNSCRKIKEDIKRKTCMES